MIIFWYIEILIVQLEFLLILWVGQRTLNNSFVILYLIIFTFESFIHHYFVVKKEIYHIYISETSNSSELNTQVPAVDPLHIADLFQIVLVENIL